MPHPLKRVIEAAATRSGLSGLLARRAAPSVAVLGYHNIVPRGESAVGDTALHVGQEAFATQLDRLLETHDIVSLDQLSLGGEGEERPRAVLTFDDAYRGTVTAGFEELRRRALPATVFVPPGLLGSAGFWWDRLAPPGGHPLDARLRDFAHGPELQGRQDKILEFARSEGLPLTPMPEWARPCGPDELLRITRDNAGVTLGSHTWTHPNLAVITPEDAAEEMSRSRDWLDTAEVATVDWFAYPYGLLDETVAATAAKLFTGALLVEGGMAQVRGTWYGDASRVPRVQVPRHLTADGLTIRLAGVLRGVLAGT